VRLTDDLKGIIADRSTSVLVDKDIFKVGSSYCMGQHDFALGFVKYIFYTKTSMQVYILESSIHCYVEIVYAKSYGSGKQNMKFDLMYL
jgi:hypothetical protein